MTLLDDPVLWAAGLPWLVLPVLVFVSAALEFVVPPYWGDTVLLLAFFLSGQGLVEPEVVFGLALLGSVLGAAITWELGRRYGLRIIEAVTPRRRHGAGRRILTEVDRFGEPVLALNRFVPVVRSFALYVAGTAGLRFGPSMVYNAISSFFWTALLMGLGIFTAGTWEELQVGARQVQGTVGLVALAAVLTALLWSWLRMASRTPSEAEVEARVDG